MYERLENRYLLAGTGIIVELSPDSTQLWVTGTNGADTIGFENSTRNIRVYDNDVPSPWFAKAGIQFVIVSAKAGNDIVVMGRTTIPTRIDGSNGNDTLAGGPGNDTIRGGGGNDVCQGNDGNDIVDGGLGADDMGGGGGRDTLDYSYRTNPVTVGLGVLPDDGEFGEGDNARTDFENVLGGSGNDQLSTSSGRAVRLFGGLGNDTLIGGSGADYFEGGSGRDSMVGSAGNDFFASQDGEIDTIIGGSGTDTGTVDSFDVVNF